MSKANERQVGGDHYKRGGEEHWDRIWRLYGRGYFIGCITKYVERYQYKDGLKDLEKAAHFLQKLMELEKGEVAPGVAYQEKGWPLADAGEPGSSYTNQDRRNRVTSHQFKPSAGMAGVEPAPADLCVECGRKFYDHF